MKKLMLGAAVSAALLGGAANAAITVNASGIPVITPANTYQVYLSGSSAAQGFIELLLTSPTVPKANKVCDSTKTIYKYSDNGNGKDQNAYLCVMNPSNPALTGLAAGKTNLLVYKRSSGGSAQGVSPIVADSAIDFLKVDDASICGAPVVSGGFSKITCTFTAGNAAQSNSQKPDFGIADVDPIQFQGDNTPSGFNPVTAADLSKLTVKAASAQAFGIAVSTKLRNALQEAQFGPTSPCNPTNAGYTPGFFGKAESATCMPTLNSAQIASIFSGKFNSWAQLKLANTSDLYAHTTVAANKPSNSRMHICRRTSGSGTQAQLGIKFFGYPCNDVATQPAVDTGALPETVAKAQVHANSSSGVMSECLAELDSGVDTIGTGFSNTYGFRWAIGIQGLEQNANLSSAWRFIKIDGVAPTLANINNGKYKDWVELTFQYNNTHAFDTSEKAIVDEIIKEAGNPFVLAATNLGAIQSFGRSGFLATPQSFSPTAGAGFDPTKPISPLSHGTTTASTNNCRMPAIYNPTTTGGMQLN